LPPPTFFGATPIKIAVFHNLPSGGALRALADKLATLVERGHRVAVYTFSTSDGDQAFPADLGQEIFVTPLDYRGFFCFKNYFESTRTAAEKINRSDVDCVLVEKCRYFGSPPILRYLKKKTLFYTQEPLRIRDYENLAPSPNTFIDPSPFKKDLFLWKRFLRTPGRLYLKDQDRKAIRSCRTVWTNSHFTAEWIRRAYGVEARVVYQGVDLQKFVPDRRTSRENFVLSVGRLDPVKGHDFVIEVLSCLPSSVRPQLKIISDTSAPKYRAHLEKKARDKKVILTIEEKIEDSRLVVLYQEAAMVLCASFHEPFGLVPLEAMACGAPVLAVEEGGYMETVVHGETGFLIRREERDWTAKIRQLLLDPLLAGRLGTSGRRHVESHWPRHLFASRFEAFFV